MEKEANGWKSGLAKTSKIAFGRIANALGATEISESIWSDLEASLIQADVGYYTASGVTESVKQFVYKEGITKAKEIKSILKTELHKRLIEPEKIEFTRSPFVILLLGVNGSGKTTSAAKLGSLFKNEGKRVMFIAADTFRAAATDQLNVWANRLGIAILSGTPGSDPGSIVYDGIKSAISKSIDIVIVDTAGRLQSKGNLMDEIKKIHKVAGKSLQGAPHATWLVLDATTGQNSIQQARIFNEHIDISGIIIAKLDTSAKGGMVFSIQKELNIPILYAGLGERAEDLRKFIPDDFIEGIMN